MANWTELIESFKRVDDNFEITMNGKQFREILASESHKAYVRGLIKGYNEVLQRIEDGESVEKIRGEL